MSRLRNVSLLNMPLSAAMTNVPTFNGASNPADVWKWGDWTEFIASAAADTQIAGIARNPSNFSGFMLVQVGTGTAGNEVARATWHFRQGSTGNIGPMHELFTIPIDLFPAGSRISVRVAQSGVGLIQDPIALLYYENLDGDHVIDQPLEHYPVPVIGTAAGDVVTLTPAGVAWDDSTPVLVSPVGGFDSNILLSTLTLTGGGLTAGIDWEMDIGLGGSPVVLATTEAGRPDATMTTAMGYHRVVFSPDFYVPADTEIWLTLRKDSAVTTAISVGINYYANVDISIVGSAVFGVDTTVTATRAIAFGLDGNTNVHDEAGKFKVFGDVEVTGTTDLIGTVTVPNDSFTNAKLADMAEATVKGRAAGAGTGDPTDLTGTQVTVIVNNFIGDTGSPGGGTKGLVPAPADGDAAAGAFLKADGTWAVPPSGGSEWSVLTNGDIANPELIFVNGDVVMVEIP